VSSIVLVLVVVVVLGFSSLVRKPEFGREGQKRGWRTGRFASASELRGSRIDDEDEDDDGDDGEELQHWAGVFHPVPSVARRRGLPYNRGVSAPRTTCL